jgi:hypothetical protein
MRGKLCAFNGSSPLEDTKWNSNGKLKFAVGCIKLVNGVLPVELYDAVQICVLPLLNVAISFFC